MSTIHKARGLECESVIVMPCDARSFPETSDGHCLFYVALGRPKSELMFVLSAEKPRSLLIL
jgi:DNA helicase-2/ATP-dependent DNA helicase PcrA